MLRNKFITAALGIGLCGLAGCERKVKSGDETSSEQYFATVPMRYETGLAMTSNDFDGDGDIDIIVGAYKSSTGMAGLYFFENDGAGNFTLRKGRD